MEIRYFTENDHEKICSWWESWGWASIPLYALPQLGIIVSNKGEDVAVGYIYSTDSCICWLEHITVNKSASREARKGVVEFLIDEACNEAKKRGFNIIMSSISHSGLLNKLVNKEFKITDRSMTNVLKVL